jgi:hypothetical protein
VCFVGLVLFVCVFFFYFWGVGESFVFVVLKVEEARSRDTRKVFSLFGDLPLVWFFCASLVLLRMRLF